MVRELIRTWAEGPYKLELFDLNERDHYGKHRLGYRFECNGALVFEGEDFACSPMHSVDSDATVGAVLGFLALRPGDTDREYFDSYTPEQLAFARAHGEHLSGYADALETGRGRVRLDRADGGAWTLTNCETGEGILFQSDWDYPSLACLFGWRACPHCTYTDGTVDCDHRTASEMIVDAQDYLYDHEGETATDPGYFE